MTVIVVGGGYGCTKVVVKIIELESDNAAEIERVLYQVLKGETFRREASKVFDALLTTDPIVWRDLSLSELRPPNVTIHAKEVIVGDKSGDTYNVSRAGIVGKDVHVVNFNQVWPRFKVLPMYQVCTISRITFR